MTATIPDSHADLLREPITVALATVNPDGQPQVTPVWCGFDGTHVVVNTARGRKKDRNIQQNPIVTVLAVDPEDDQRYIQVQGVADGGTVEGAVEVIDQLSKDYTGKYPFFGGYADAGRAQTETRVTYKITPTRVTVGD